MGEATGTAAREHEAERSARDSPCEAGGTDVEGGVVDEVVRRGLGRFQPLRRSPSGHRRLQDEVAAARFCGDRHVRPGQNDRTVGLPPAEGIPLAVAVARDQEHRIVCGLRSREQRRAGVEPSWPRSVSTLPKRASSRAIARASRSASSPAPSGTTEKTRGRVDGVASPPET